MTTDDTPIPRSDAAARAARLGLGQLASSEPAGDLSWGAVKAGARRVQRRRLAVVGVACAIFLLGGSAAVAAVSRDSANHVSVAGSGGSTTTTTTETASTTIESTVTSPPLSGGTVSPTPSSTPEPVSEPASALPAQPHDLAGTLTLTSTALQVNALAPFTLTLRNVSDHSVSIVDYPQGIQALAIHVKTPTVGGFSSTVVADVSVLAPGEQHDFTGSGGVSDPFMIGPARLGADLIVKTGVWPDERFEYRSLAAVSQIAVDIVPPGWTAGPPLDPSLGEWSVRMSADATEVHAGDVVRMRAVVRNAGDLPQTTEGYGSLAIVCSNGTTVFGRFIDSTTLQPGAEQTFSTLVQSPEWLVGRYDCSLGLGFGGNIGNARSHRGIESDSIAITVLPALEPTTTTAPELTTSTTTP